MKAFTAAVLALVGVLALHASPAAAITDFDVANFALNLDCLEVNASPADSPLTSLTSCCVQDSQNS